MPTISTVLRHAGTAPPDFTLHDDEHSLRVAERMVDLIPDDSFQALTGYELALMLLAAYLHDIGLSPDRGLVTAHYTYVLTGDDTRLSADDSRLFRGWLDQYGRGVVPPLLDTTASHVALSRASQVVATYCRARHADWSVRWIDTNLTGLSMGAYAAWLTDLRALCLSHNEGRAALLEPGLNPRLVAPQTVVNLRYLACALRVADVIDVDPERTPSVVFRQRDVSPASAIYWHKDHEIVLDVQGDTITLTARPPSAPLHRAVVLTADQIDTELGLCRDLADRGSFGNCPGYGALPHKWPSPATCFRDIAPRDDAYVYIDGDFRPDTDRILALLGGVALYGTPLAALRELLQNASDAIAEQSARVRLEWDDPNDPDRVSAARTLNRIDLAIRQRDGAYGLTAAIRVSA